ncbi:MAG: FAD binding domain-containing protein [Deltaproteobacteria bacterium]|nr:FAD binding domain-containing protein [Deltaproteobacteria bacterium]
MRYVAAGTLDDAVNAVAAGAVPLAGGTDLLVAWERRAHPDAVCDLQRVPGLRGVEAQGDRIWVGALTTHADLGRAPLLLAAAPLLREAASSIGAVQVRSRGTVGGNVVNASPAGDVLTALYALDAAVELRGPSGARTLPIAEFVKGPRRTALASGEILTGLTFPRPGPELQGYEKLGLRAAQAIAVVSLAVRLRLDGGVVQEAALALGSVAPTPVRALAAEAVLRGRPLDGTAVRAAARALSATATPIDDVRASAEYRRAMAGALLERFLERAGLPLAAAASPA